MIEVALILAAFSAAGIILVLFFLLHTRTERDQARTDLAFERQVNKALEGRVTTLRGDNITLEQANKILADQLEDARREIGRMEAEHRAAKPKRGANGKFVAKKPKPVSCG